MSSAPAPPSAIGLVRRGYSASGGAESYLVRLATGLRDRGVEARLFTTADWPEERWDFGPIVRLKGRSPGQFARAFAAARPEGLVTLTLDRVPGCDVFRAGDGVHAAWLYRRGLFEPKWRKFLHLVNPKHLAMMRLECEVFQTVRGVIANSHLVAEEIVKWHDFPRERIIVIPNGIGRPLPAVPKAEARAQLGLPADVPVALFVGTGWERKGLRFALNAVEKFGRGTRLLVAGRGPSDRYRSPVAQFLGPVRDLAPLFSAADVFVLPTIYDPFSNACLEALAAGLPVITTSANGFSEILTPGVHGSVVAAGDIPALTSALEFWADRAGPETRQVCQALAAEYPIARNVTATLEVLEAARAPS
jgi:UDP-glucose:(heptosyl)LPS alpha-1,3-glucosyltransferase